MRRPGLILRVDPETNEDTDAPLLRTAEAVHSSVRVRLACGGLGMDDKERWDCPALLKDKEGGKLLWRLERVGEADGGGVSEFKPRELLLGEAEYPTDKLYPANSRTGKWQWVFAQSDAGEKMGAARVPQSTVLPEEPLVGYWERFLLWTTVGNPDVWMWAEKNPPLGAMGLGH